MLFKLEVQINNIKEVLLTENTVPIIYRDLLVKLFREIIAVYVENHAKHINIFCTTTVISEF